MGASVVLDVMLEKQSLLENTEQHYEYDVCNFIYLNWHHFEQCQHEIDIIYVHTQVKYVFIYFYKSDN